MRTSCVYLGLVEMTKMRKHKRSYLGSGHPLAGLGFVSAVLTASVQSPLILTRAGCGPLTLRLGR